MRMPTNHPNPSSAQYAEAIDLDRLYLTPLQVAAVRLKIALAYLDGRMCQVEQDKQMISHVLGKREVA